MPRKPNYKFERFERDRAKAVKKAARLQAKADRRTAKPGEDGVVDESTVEGVTAPEETGEADSATN